MVEIVCHHCYKEKKDGRKEELPQNRKPNRDEFYPVVIVPKRSGLAKNTTRMYKFLDFESNVLALVSYLHVGCGPSEVGLILANLNLEEAGKLERAYYQYIDRISSHIRDAADKAIEVALEAEVVETYKRMLLEEGKDDETIEERVKDVKKNELTQLVGLDVAYDMGW